MLAGMDARTSLTLAALAWFALHVGVAGSGLRDAIASRTGERAFRGLFSLSSIGSFGWLLFAYRRAPCDPLWVTPHAFYIVPVAFVPIAFVLLFGAFSVPNPAALGGRKALERLSPAKGILRITRHPFLWAVMLWAGAHLIVNGNRAAVLLFGTLLATAAVGTGDIDRKRRARDPDAWRRFAEVTSNMPLLAVLQRRNRLVWRELVLPVVAGLALSAVVLHFHVRWFGVSANRFFGH